MVSEPFAASNESQSNGSGTAESVAFVGSFFTGEGEIVAVEGGAAKILAGAGRGAAFGGVSQTGARTLIVAQYLAREAEAERAYEAIRATDDVAAIARNTGMRVQKIARIKNHLFNDVHPRSGGMARFDADADIAEAWQRLHSGSQLPRDIDLLNHEYFESKVMSRYKTSYEIGHAAAESRYPANLPSP